MSQPAEPVPAWERPIPADASEQDRRENALFHLGRILGAAMLLERQLGSPPPELLLEILAAAKRAATWLGATLWENEAQAGEIKAEAAPAPDPA